ncbi:MAG: O-antigen ligase family protein [Bacteroidales bacterium]|nr:O-antigen ligase family protein [Bacteroidales bacterium]
MPTVVAIFIIMIAINTHGLYEYQGIFSLLVLVSLSLLPLIRNKIQWALQDYLFGLFLLYILSKEICAPQPSAHIIYWSKVLLCALVYLASKLFTSKIVSIIYNVIIAAGLFEIILCILQFIGILHSHNQYCIISGTFDNPAHLAIFLSVWMVIFIHACNNGSNTRLTLCIAGTVLAFFIILYCKSRTAIIISIFGLIFSLFESQLKKKPSQYIIAILIIACFGVSYYARPGSADARTLIWKSSIIHAAKQPIFGNGNNSFQADYMYNQKNYFLAHEAPKLALVANNNFQAFNETVHVFYEHGFVGLFILFVGIALTLYKLRRKEKIIACMLLFASQFIYLIDIHILCIMLFFILGQTVQNNKEQEKSSKGFVLCFVFIILTISSFSVNTFVCFKKADKTITTLTKENPFISTQEGIVLNDRHFALRYAKWLNSLATPEALDRVEYISNNIIATTDMLIDLGDGYLSLNRYSEAEEHYINASLMIPSLITPKIKLLHLYKTINNKEKALLEAQSILYGNYKKIGSAVLRGKAEAKEYIIKNI